MGALSVILIAGGAVLTFAVADRVDGVDLSIVGIILMAVGVIGLFASLMRGRGTARVRTERTITDDGRTVVEDREATRTIHTASRRGSCATRLPRLACVAQGRVG